MSLDAQGSDELAYDFTDEEQELIHRLDKISFGSFADMLTYYLKLANIIERKLDRRPEDTMMDHYRLLDFNPEYKALGDDGVIRDPENKGLPFPNAVSAADIGGLHAGIARLIRMKAAGMNPQYQNSGLQFVQLSKYLANPHQLTTLFGYKVRC